ncbi:MAG: O-antigen ligase family protein [Acidobacteria bacterium]|nr:O-antigen ligase family protein [Acidobacteriota bacterium]
MRRNILLPVVIAFASGAVVLMINGLPLTWGLLMLGGLLLPAGALMIPAPRRFLEVCLMLSFGISMDIHLGNDLTHRVDPAGLPVSLTGVLICVLAAWWLIERVGERPHQSLFGGMGIPILGLWMTSICSMLVSSAPRFGVYGLINLAYFTLLFLYLANNISTPHHLRRLLSWLMVAVGVTSILALIEAGFGRTDALVALGMLSKDKIIAGTEVRRVGGLLGGANMLAMVLVQLLPLMLAFFLSPLSGYRKPLLVAGFGVGVLALIFTYSRGGWLVFGLTLLILLSMMASRRVSGSHNGWLGKVVVLVFLLALLAAPLCGHVYTRLTEDDRGSAYSRLPMMQVALRIIEDNPLFGVGLGNYVIVMNRYDQGPERIHQNFPWPVHNIYLNITAEIGVLGGLCFLLACLLAMRQGIQALRASDPFLRTAAAGLMIGLLGFLLVGMKELGPLGSDIYRYFWLAVGLLVATRRLAVPVQIAECAEITASERAQDSRFKAQVPRRKTEPACRRIIQRPREHSLGLES